MPRDGVEEFPLKKVTSEVSRHFRCARRLRFFRSHAGLDLDVACAAHRYCSKKLSIALSSWSKVNGLAAFIADFSVPTNFSAAPFEHGCLGAVRRCLHPIDFSHSAVSCATNGVPLSLTKTCGTPSLAKHFRSALTVNFAVAFSVRNTSGQWENESQMIKA